MARQLDGDRREQFAPSDDTSIRKELERVLQSATFSTSTKLRELLRFTVERALSRQQAELKESILGMEVYRRKPGYDVRADSIVRVEARRLRKKLNEYYAAEGRDDRVKIDFPKGGYVPLFRERDQINRLACGPIVSLIVLPFGTLSWNKGRDYFSEGLTEELISTLASLPGLRVIARTSAFAFQEERPDLHEIGQMLNVGAALLGTVRRSGSRVRISVRLVQTADGCCIFARQFDRRLSDAVTVQEEIARALAKALEIELDHIPPAFSSRRSDNVEAHELYLKGRYWWHRWGPNNAHRAAEFFQGALSCDPLFAPAYAGLADCFFLRGYWGADPPFDSMHKARAAATRAIELDDSLAEAHCSLALIENAHMWDSARCREELEYCLRLKPGSALALSKYGTSYLTPLGRVDEAKMWIEQAWALDPLSPQINLDLALNLLYSGRAADAVARCQRTLELATQFLRAYWVLGLAYAETGALSDAIEAVEAALRISPDDPRSLVLLAGFLDRSGHRTRADAVAARLHSLVSARMRPMMFALVSAAFGQADQAFDYLEAAYAQRDPQLRLLRVHPTLRLLAEDRRYTALVERVRLLS